MRIPRHRFKVQVSPLTEVGRIQIVEAVGILANRFAQRIYAVFASYGDAVAIAGELSDSSSEFWFVEPSADPPTSLLLEASDWASAKNARPVGPVQIERREPQSEIVVGLCNEHGPLPLPLIDGDFCAENQLDKGFGLLN